MVALASISCIGEISVQERGAFSLRSSDDAQMTKAGRNTIVFPEGTTYYFQALRHDSKGLVLEPSFFSSTGVEDATHIIRFPEDVPNLYQGNTLDFYGLTFASQEAFPDADVSSVDGRPVFVLAHDNEGRLADLRRGELKGQSSINPGELEVRMRHALSRLNFMAVKQDVPELAGAYVEEIMVVDSEAARLDLVSGGWTLSSDMHDYSVYSNDGSSDLLTGRASLLSDADCLMFPHADHLGLKVRVVAPASERGVLEIEYDVDLMSILGSGMESNHEYTISITVLNSDIKIVMLVPQQYPWMEGLVADFDLGQPVTFGGVTWSDRNVGATSATYNTVSEWDDMRGYYFQFGRNIPYFVFKNRKMSAPNTAISQGSAIDWEGFDYSFSLNNAPEVAPFPLVDGDSKDRAVAALNRYYSGQTGLWKAVGTGTYPLTYYNNFNGSGSNQYGSLAIDPDEWQKWDGAGDYDFDHFSYVAGAANDSSPWWPVSAGTPRTWDDPSHQPCPKGWKVPTKEDWASIMPLSKRTGDICFNPSNTSGTFKTISGYTSENSSKYGSEFFSDGQLRVGAANSEFLAHKKVTFWAETGGDRTVTYSGLQESLGDPYLGYTTQYVCRRGSTSDFYGTLYAIKCQGTNIAYRVRWEYKRLDDKDRYRPVSNNQYPTVLVISRYPATSTDRLQTEAELDSFDWDNPSEQMVLPICGQIFSESYPRLSNAGAEAAYACSSIEGNSAEWYYVVRIKAGGNEGTRYMMLSTMRRAYGMVVRCVRDNTVVID